MHRDIQDELQSNAGADLQEQQAAFDIWRKTFNEERPHESLGMKSPSELYRKSTRKYTGAPADILYEDKISRKVSSAGMISIDNDKIRVSEALAGWSVGLKPLDKEYYDVYFARLRIGQIDRNTATFLRGASPPEEGSAAVQQSTS